MGLIWTACIGLIVGALGKFIMPGKDPGGILMTMVIGIAGAFVAGFLGRILGWYQPGQGAGLIASVIGALLLLWAYRKFGTKTTERAPLSVASSLTTRATSWTSLMMSLARR